MSARRYLLLKIPTVWEPLILIIWNAGIYKVQVFTGRSFKIDLRSWTFLKVESVTQNNHLNRSETIIFLLICWLFSRKRIYFSVVVFFNYFYLYFYLVICIIFLFYFYFYFLNYLYLLQFSYRYELMLWH